MHWQIDLPTAWWVGASEQDVACDQAGVATGTMTLEVQPADVPVLQPAQPAPARAARAEVRESPLTGKLRSSSDLHLKPASNSSHETRAVLVQKHGRDDDDHELKNSTSQTIHVFLPTTSTRDV